MITNRKLNLIHNLLYKDSEYNMGGRILEYDLDYDNSSNWSCESEEDYSIIYLQPTFNLDTFKNFDYVKYMVNEFDLDVDFFNYDYENSLTLLVLLHEYGHAHELRNTLTVDEFEDKLDEHRNNERAYRLKLLKLMMNEDLTMNEKDYEMNILYRSKDSEYYADSIASQIFNKYAIKLLSIISGKSQKQIRLEMSR